MRLQLLSDLHLETETFEPAPAPDAELLVLAGDVDASWAGLEKFRGWPVPVLFVAGNHEFDGRELTQAWPQLRAHCAALGLRLLECESLLLTDRAGQRVRFVATIRWSDFDLFGPAQRARAMRAGGYFAKIMRATRHGHGFDAEAVRAEALICRDWLSAELKQSRGAWDKTVVITHFAPSFRSADPRYGAQAGSASFCNADDALLGCADLWIHGHVHCRHDYTVAHEPVAGSTCTAPSHVSSRGATRVICNSRGHARKGEADGYRPLQVFEV